MFHESIEKQCEIKVKLVMQSSTTHLCVMSPVISYTGHEPQNAGQRFLLE